MKWAFYFEFLLMRFKQTICTCHSKVQWILLSSNTLFKGNDIPVQHHKGAAVNAWRLGSNWRSNEWRLDALTTRPRHLNSLSMKFSQCFCVLFLFRPLNLNKKRAQRFCVLFLFRPLMFFSVHQSFKMKCMTFESKRITLLSARDYRCRSLKAVGGKKELRQTAAADRQRQTAPLRTRAPWVHTGASCSWSPLWYMWHEQNLRKIGGNSTACLYNIYTWRFS